MEAVLLRPVSPRARTPGLPFPWLNFFAWCAVTTAVRGAIKNSAGGLFRHGWDVVECRCQAIARESRYGHYVRIPERICRCLDYFKLDGDRLAVKERLRAYYLFIGVVDDAIDSGDL